MILNVLSPNVLRTLQNPAIFWRSEFWTWKTNTSQGFSTWSLQNLSRSNWFTIFYSLERYFFLGCSFARTIMKSKWSQILRTGLMLDLVLRYAGSDALRITPISSDLISGAVFSKCNDECQESCTSWGQGRGYFFAAALMVRVIYQGCAAVLIRKVDIYKALRACRRPCNY